MQKVDFVKKNSLKKPKFLEIDFFKINNLTW